MSKKEEVAVVVVVEEGRRWEGLNPEILALIFLRIQPTDEMVRCVPFVCKPWNKVVAEPYCWWLIDVLEWCRHQNEDDAAEVVVKLLQRSNYTAQRLSACYIGESEIFLSVVNCGSCLKVLQIPESRITDDMILKHIKPLPNLIVLDISRCSEITHIGLAAFGNNCKSLVRLRRNTDPFNGHFSSIEDSEAKAIAHTMSNLKRLELCYGSFGNSGLSEILTKCKSIIHLDIYGSCNVDMELDGDLLEITNRLEHFRRPWNIDHVNDYDEDPINSKDVDLPSPTSD